MPFILLVVEGLFFARPGSGLDNEQERTELYGVTEPPWTDVYYAGSF